MPTNPTNPVQQLVQALLTISQNTAVPPPPPNPPATNQSHIHTPDTFDGSNPKDLWAFLLQCQITFNPYLHQYLTDTAKVFFTISYLKKTVLEWFKQGMLEDDPEFVREPTLGLKTLWVQLRSTSNTLLWPAIPG